MKVNSLDEADLVIQKLPCDIGIHRNPRKGTLNGPEEILDGFEFSKNVLVDDVFPDEFSLENTHRRIEDNTEELLDYEKPLISLGGDHSISYPVIRALKRRNPGLKLVWLDSHLDLKEKVENHVSHDVVVRELLRHGFSEEEIYLVGITQIDGDEEQFMHGSNLNIYRSSELDKFLREFKEDEQPVYLSVDIDVLKEQLAPGTGYTDGELGIDSVRKVIEAVEPDHGDLVEVAPPLDIENKTLKNSKKILELLERQISQ